MRIKLDIDVSLSPRARWAIAWVLTPLAMLSGSTVAHAWTDGLNTDWIQPGKPISASLLRGLLDQANARMNVLEEKIGMYTVDQKSAQYSLAAVYVTSTNKITPGDMSGLDMPSGYRSGKLACEEITGSPSAHMCTCEELSRSAALGIKGPDQPGWYTCHFRADYITDTVSSGKSNSDCDGWRNNDANHVGMATGNTWEPAGLTCDKKQPILCCD